MNASSVITKDYENNNAFRLNGNKAKQTQSNPISKPAPLRPLRLNLVPFRSQKSSKLVVKSCKKLTLLILGLGFCLSGCAVNPITGQKHLNFFTPQQEVEIGRKYAPQIEEQMGGKIENVTLQNYLDNVGQKIARVSHTRQWEYHFYALEDKSVNAFALPGGYVFITRGMLEKLNSEAQLASILAHETVHVVARHSSRAMTKQIGYQMVLSTITSEETSKTVLNVADLTWQIVGLKYSRADEQEADVTGLDYLVSAGYNPYAMVETMQMLQSQQKTRPIEFLSTHPVPENRIEYLTRKIQTTYNLSELKTGTDDYQKAVLDQLAN
ncbi:M48 family metalloprotease [Planctomycetota bacterium]